LNLDWVTEHRFQVMDALYSKGRKTLTEISENTESEPPLNHKTCKKLVQINILEKDEASKSYALTDAGRTAYEGLKQVKHCED